MTTDFKKFINYFETPNDNNKRPDHIDWDKKHPLDIIEEER